MCKEPDEAKTTSAAGGQNELLVMPDFKREIRYVILKISHMDETQKEILPRLLEVNGLEPITGLVVEPDWPEYEPTWKAIEDRMNSEA